MSKTWIVVVAAASVLAVSILESCANVPADATATLTSADRHRHEQEVMRSAFCAKCHPVMYAEHEQNTHGRAFTDEEVRLATGRFNHGDCIICHTPRPVFETGIGMNPRRRYHNLEEGNTCMTCHWKQGHDYGTFQGGAECKTAFDDRVGTVEACASCHRNHGTPFQWELAEHGKPKGVKCMDCHMEMVRRPVAVGMEPREVRSHVFPGGRSESQLRRAYRYTAEIDGNEVSVKIENRGVGHNFPTELKQRSLESLIVVKDRDGNEVARSRMVFRDPYKRPYGLKLPVNTQIRSGEMQEHRVPIGVAEGTVECELHYKLYYPIEDHHPDLARQLEDRRLPFDGVTPSTKSVETAPEVKIRVPENIDVRQASPAQLVDFARPEIGTVQVDIPEGDSAEDIADLIELFQFPVPQANAEARNRLTEIGMPAVPQLIEALGSWDNKTYNQSMTVLERIGLEAAPSIVAALDHDQLYVRIHARELLVRLQPTLDGIESKLERGLAMPNALDRSTSALALGELGFRSATAALRRLLADEDPDVVREAAAALAAFDDRDSIDPMRAALHRFIWPETRRDLASALIRLGDADQVRVLLHGLDHEDDLIRESYFESLFELTGLHFAYDPLAPRPDRLEAMSDLERFWARFGGADRLRQPIAVPRSVHNEVWHIMKALGGGDGLTPGGDDAAMVQRLIEIGDVAVPVLIQGLKYPPGFSVKRSRVCEALGRIGSRYAVPGLVGALRDPVVAVGSWACWALGEIGDEASLPALQRYDGHLRSLAAAGRIPNSAGQPDQLLATAAAARLTCGDEQARIDLASLLLSDVDSARQTAIQALRRIYGETRGYVWNANEDERRAAAALWSR